MLKGIKGISTLSKVVLFLLLSIHRKVRTEKTDRYVDLILSKFFYQKKIETNDHTYILLDVGSFNQIQPRHEGWIWRYMKPNKGDVFVDIGANIGKYTIKLSRIIGNSGLIVAIEPLPEIFAALKEAISLNSFRNVIAVNCACWSEESEVRIFKGDNYGWSSLVWDWGHGHTFVEAKPLDMIVEDLGLGRVDYVKIDVEGSEAQVIKGMLETLRLYRPDVMIEISSDQTRNEIVKIIENVDYEYEIIEKEHEYLFLRPHE